MSRTALGRVRGCGGAWPGHREDRKPSDDRSSLDANELILTTVPQGIGNRNV
jgi:hypothetical protein